MCWRNLMFQTAAIGKMETSIRHIMIGWREIEMGVVYVSEEWWLTWLKIDTEAVDPREESKVGECGWREKARLRERERERKRERERAGGSVRVWRVTVNEAEDRHREAVDPTKESKVGECGWRETARVREKGREVASTTEDSKIGECGWRERER